jgi:nicotinamidase-related amidase
VPELAPAADDIVITKTTDSALTGTNLRLILSNMGIENVLVAGIFTDQCVSCTRVTFGTQKNKNVITIDALIK